MLVQPDGAPRLAQDHQVGVSGGLRGEKIVSEPLVEEGVLEAVGRGNLQRSSCSRVVSNIVLPDYID